MIDLHTHSNKSDGSLTPSALIDMAVEKGLSAIALTDHDTVDGLDEAIARGKELSAGKCGNAPAADETAKGAQPPLPHPVEVIPGIEFSTEYEKKDVHIVGLYIDYQNPAFQKYLKDFVNSRTDRNIKMCKKLREEAGMDISYEKLQQEFPGAVITRAHYARYMLSHGYIRNLHEAFDRYIGDNCRYFIPREKVTPVQAVQLILKAHGIPVLAHPILYRLSEERLEKLTAGLKDAGLIAIEALYSTYNPAEERQIRRLAGKYDLCISGGSDFHGACKPGLELGTGFGNLFIPDDILTELKKHIQKRK